MLQSQMIKMRQNQRDPKNDLLWEGCLGVSMTLFVSFPNVRLFFFFGNTFVFVPGLEVLKIHAIENWSQFTIENYRNS